MFTTRSANIADVPRLVEIERKTWSGEGTEIYGEDHFLAWLETYPEGFSVVEEEGVIVGLSCIQAVDFGPSDRSAFTTFNEVTDHGYIRRTHNPAGRYYFGVTMCSLSRGGGKALLRAVLELSGRTGRPLMGTSRISGFADYFQSAAAAGVSLDEDAIALSYVLACARMNSGKVWKSMPVPPAHVQPLPAVAVPDPVLKFYLRHPDLGLYAVLPAFMQDPPSRDYSVLFGQDLLP